MINIPFVTARRTIEIAKEEIDRLFAENRLIFGEPARAVLEQEAAVRRLSEMPGMLHVQADPEDVYKIHAQVCVPVPLDNIELHFIN